MFVRQNYPQISYHVKDIDRTEKIQRQTRQATHFIHEPRHVISNNVAFDKCRLRRDCAASFYA